MAHAQGRRTPWARFLAPVYRSTATGHAPGRPVGAPFARIQARIRPPSRDRPPQGRLNRLPRPRCEKSVDGSDQEGCASRRAVVPRSRYGVRTQGDFAMRGSTTMRSFVVTARAATTAAATAAVVALALSGCGGSPSTDATTASAGGSASTSASASASASASPSEATLPAGSQWVEAPEVRHPLPGARGLEVDVVPRGDRLRRQGGDRRGGQEHGRHARAARHHRRPDRGHRLRPDGQGLRGEHQRRAAAQHRDAVGRGGDQPAVSRSAARSARPRRAPPRWASRSWCPTRSRCRTAPCRAAPC